MEPGHQSKHVKRVQRQAVVGSALAALGACLWAGCSGNARPPAPPAVAASPYVGAAACAECHRPIFDRQAASNHARTLRAGGPAELPDGSRAAGPIKDKETGLEYRIEPAAAGTRQVVTQDGREVASANLDYLLGSGHHGTSPMSFDGKEWRYLSLTFYGAHGWDFSPMHGIGNATARRKNATGWPVTQEELQKCFGCHSTRLGFHNAALDPAQTELGVRCESCHGPGRAHIEAVRAKATDRAIQNPRKWSNESFMALCQQCHNETATLEGTLFGVPEDPADPGAVKYHVYGISRSRCFKESGERFRCTTCHNPHANSETRPAFYEAKCLSCHSGATPEEKPCPVNRKTGCLSCHMPKVQVEKHTYFADHWIRARSPFLKKSGK